MSKRSNDQTGASTLSRAKDSNTVEKSLHVFPRKILLYWSLVLKLFLYERVSWKLTADLERRI